MFCMKHDVSILSKGSFTPHQSLPAADVQCSKTLSPPSPQSLLPPACQELLQGLKTKGGSGLGPKDTELSPALLRQLLLPHQTWKWRRAGGGDPARVVVKAIKGGGRSLPCCKDAAKRPGSLLLVDQVHLHNTCHISVVLHWPSARSKSTAHCQLLLCCC